jgi:hypothetical protein
MQTKACLLSDIAGRRAGRYLAKKAMRSANALVDGAFEPTQRPDYIESRQRHHEN